MSETSDTIDRSIAVGEFEVAEEAAIRAIRSEPEDLALRVSYAECLAKQLTFDRGIEQCLHVLNAQGATEAQALAAVNLLTKCAAQLGMPDLARPYLERANFRHSPFPSDRCWHSRLLRQLGRFDEALSELESVLLECPDDPFVSYLVGETMLMMGRDAGRRRFMDFSGRAFFRVFFSDHTLVERMWEGESLHGRSIVIVPTAGHGDYFQLACHIRQLKHLGARHVTAVAAGRYRQLLASAGVDDVVGWPEAEDAKHRSDAWVGTFGLARADAAGGGWRKPSGYMTPPASAPADAVAGEMRARAAGKVCIGLYWHSDQYHGEAKSIPLHCLAPLLARDDIHWLILQQGFGLRRLREAGIGRDATIPGDLPFDDTGSLMRQLDGVATICAWPFHLAGAVGTRTWLLAGRILEARHLNSERDSYLYPDLATVARQPRLGDWPGAIARLNDELDLFIRQKQEAA